MDSDTELIDILSQPPPENRKSDSNGTKPTLSPQLDTMQSTNINYDEIESMTVQMQCHIYILIVKQTRKEIQ